MQKKKQQQQKTELHNRFVHTFEMKANMQTKSQQLCLTSWISNSNSVRAIENMYLSSSFVWFRCNSNIRFILVFVISWQNDQMLETFYLAASKGKALVAVFEGC